MADVLWIHYALPRTSWYELPRDRQEELRERWAGVRAASLEAGARTEGAFNVRGQGDFSTVEVWRFPTVEAAYGYWEALTAAGYGRWFESANNVGTKVSGP